MRLYDLSPLISPALAVWPGDTPPSREVLLDRSRGDTVTLSTLRATVHLGSHADAPSHVSATGRGIEGIDVARFIGPCQVMRVAVSPGTRVGPGNLTGAVTAPRLLLATGTAPDSGAWHPDFAALEPALVDLLADQGVTLIGIDTPSVDLMASKDLPAHHACLRRDVLILEGLVLAGVPDGRYELIALPLRLAGFDASPVRAILRG